MPRLLCREEVADEEEEEDEEDEEDEDNCGSRAITEDGSAASADAPVTASVGISHTDSSHAAA